MGFPEWLPVTYFLDDELPEFMGEFKEREEKHKNNIWILKPHNMARTIDTIATPNIDIITKMMDTGSKIVQKYIHRPLTYKRKKIDLRFIVLLRSV